MNVKAFDCAAWWRRADEAFAWLLDQHETDAVRAWRDTLDREMASYGGHHHPKGRCWWSPSTFGRWTLGVVEARMRKEEAVA